MTRAQSPVNRFFVSLDYSIYLRQANQLVWQNQVTSHFALLTVLTGELECFRNEQPTQLSQSQSLIIEPNLNLTAKGKHAKFLLLAISPSLVIEHAIAMHLITPQSMVAFNASPIESDSRISDVASNLVLELTDEQPGKEIVIRALGEQALVHLLRNYSTPRRSDELELSRVGLVDRRIRRSVELMHSQLDQNLALKSLAAASYLSPFHFSRLFKKLTGATPHNYLAAIRVGRAQSLLAETDMSITEVGSRVGYLSASHFTKAFRLATGTTPREFRKGLIKR
jgi:AraC family transcriptional regulator